MAKVKARDMVSGVESLNLSNVNVNGGSHTASTEKWQLALLWGIHDELKKLNRVFACHNAQDIPNILRRIDKNTKKRVEEMLNV